MKDKINKTRTILLLYIDKEINLSFSSSKPPLKINSKDTKEILQQYTDSLVVSFTNPIDTNSTYLQNRSSSNFLLLRKSRTTFTQKKSKNQIAYNKKISLSRLKLRLKSLHEEEDSVKQKMKREDYYKGYHYLVNLAYNLLPSNDSLCNDKADSNENDNDNYYNDRSIINEELKQYLYNEDYDSEDDSIYTDHNYIGKQIKSFPELIVLHPMD